MSDDDNMLTMEMTWLCSFAFGAWVALVHWAKKLPDRHETKLLCETLGNITEAVAQQRCNRQHIHMGEGTYESEGGGR